MLKLIFAGKRGLEPVARDGDRRPGVTSPAEPSGTGEVTEITSRSGVPAATAGGVGER